MLVLTELLDRAGIRRPRVRQLPCELRRHSLRFAVSLIGDYYVGEGVRDRLLGWFAIVGGGGSLAVLYVAGQLAKGFAQSDARREGLTPGQG